MPAEKEIFQRSKPHLNIGTIGQSGHGKSRLTVALCHHLGYRADQIRYEESRAMPIQLEYETEARHFVHFDCPGHGKYIKNTILGMSQLDAAILVVDMRLGLQPQAREHIILARHFGLNLLVYLAGSEIAGTVTWITGYTNLTNFLRGQQYPSVPIVYGGLEELVNCLDELPVPHRQTGVPLFMPIAQVIRIPGTGYVATGRIESGVVRQIDEVEIVGREESQVTTVTGLETCRKVLDEGRAGDQVSLLLRGVSGREVRKGQVICSPGGQKAVTQFRAKFEATELYIIDYPRFLEVGDSHQFHFFIRGCGVPGSLFSETRTRWGDVLPDESGALGVKLDQPTVVRNGEKIVVRDSGVTIGTGVVVEVLG